MKASKFIILVGGILGLIAFFLPLITLKGTTETASAFQIVKGIDDAQTAISKDVKTNAASMSRDSKAFAKGADDGLGAIKGFVFAIFLPALVFAVIGGLGVARKKFGRVAGTFSLILGLLGLGVAALLRSAAAESTSGGAGIALTLLIVTGLAGIVGGIMALVKPERPATAPMGHVPVRA